MAQFVSAGHVLGFDRDGYFVSNGTYALRVRFEGAQASAPITAGADRASSEAGASQKKQAALLESVAYAEVWPGISVTYDAPGGGIARSTWTLAPGAEPTAIRLRYNRPVEVTASGELGLRFERGLMTESRPVAWQEVDGHRRTVEVAFDSLAGDLVGFRVGEYRRDLPLVIDPTLTWNTFLGGSNHDYGLAIAVDGSGNVYVAGHSQGTWGSPVRAFASGYDAFAAKLDSSGALTWNTFLGSSGADLGAAIAVDGNGNVYVSGYSNVTWGSPLRAYSGGYYDAFAAKLSASGALIWNTFLGGSSTDVGAAIAVDASANVYVSGYSDATWGSPVRAYTVAAGSDAFAAKLSSSGALSWNTFLGSGGNDAGYAIAVDGSGNVYVAGTSNVAWGSPVRAYTGGDDAFAAKLSSSGVLTWNAFLGGAGNDLGYAIAVDGSGNVYVSGYSDAAWGSPVRAHNGSGQYDAFATKLSSSGALAWNTFLGGSENDYGYGITVDGSDNIYVAGYSTATWGSPVRAFNYYSDAFAAKLSSSGALSWNIFLGGSGTDDGHAIAVDGSGNVYVGGTSDLAWGGPVRAHYGSSHDPFVAKLLPTTCGDEVTEGAEQCDDGNTANGDCCSSTCQFESSATVCRGAVGVCDLAENCTGTSATCPVDVKSTVVCGTAAGDCDVAESCDGVGNNCPADGYKSANTQCRGAAGVCDVAENCTGTSAACPTDVKSTAVCRTAAGDCDVAESCNGVSNDCPTDGYRSANTPCRAAAGVCDLAENCTGTSATCPTDAKSAAVCRTSVGDCDVPESCDGVSNNCAPDSFLPTNTECRAPAGVCDVADKCTGSSASCPADGFLPATAECRAPAGVCDAAEKCTGTSALCPVDGFLDSTTQCRDAAGACDLAENCTGTDASCPTDAKSTAECRASTGECDVADNCDGVGNDCQADAFQPSTTSCTADTNLCTDDHCDGSGTCAHPANTVPCDDGDQCTVNDRCADTVCKGDDVIVKPACRWVMMGGYGGNNPNRPKQVGGRIRENATVTGDICGDTVRVGGSSLVTGDLVATRSACSGSAGVELGPKAGVQDVNNVIVTGGSTVIGKPFGVLLQGFPTGSGTDSLPCEQHMVPLTPPPGYYDTTGDDPLVAECDASRRTLAGYVNDLDAVGLCTAYIDPACGRIPAGGTLFLGPGVVDPCISGEIVAGQLNYICLNGTLTASTDAAIEIDDNGDTGTEYVLIVSGATKLLLRSKITLVPPLDASRVLIYGKKKCYIGDGVHGAGTLVCPKSKLQVWTGVEWQGALLSGNGYVQVGDNSIVTHVPLLFSGE